MCIYYFFDQLNQPNILLIHSSINFWIIITFLIYLSGTFFLNIYVESMISINGFEKQYVLINSSFNILKNILLSVAMLMQPDNKTSNRLSPEDKLTVDWNRSL
jgi:hypothetical protein